MKKLTPLLLAFAMIFSLCACGGGDTPAVAEPQTDTSTPANSNSTSDPQCAKIGDTVTVDNWEITVESFEYRALVELKNAGNNLHGYCAYVLVKNTGKTSENFDYTRIKINFDDGYLFEIFDARYAYKSGTDDKMNYQYLDGINDTNNKIEPLSSHRYFLSFNGQSSMMSESEKEMNLIVAKVNESDTTADVIFEIDRTQVAE